MASVYCGAFRALERLFYLMSACSVGTPGSEGACTHQQEASADNMHIFNRAPSAYRSDLPPPAQTHARHALRLLQMSMCACPCARERQVDAGEPQLLLLFKALLIRWNAADSDSLRHSIAGKASFKLSESQRLKVSRFPRVSVSLKWGRGGPALHQPELCSSSWGGFTAVGRSWKASHLRRLLLSSNTRPNGPTRGGTSFCSGETTHGVCRPRGG